MRLVGALFGVILVLGTVGCAFTDETLTMPLTTSIAGVQGGDGRKIHIVIPFRDGRQHTRCGMKKNGYNMDTADIRCSHDPMMWMANILSDQLRAAGFQVVSSADEITPTTLNLEGHLEVFFSEPVLHFASVGNETDLSATLTVRTHNGLEATRTFYAKGEDSSMLAWTLSLADKSFRDAADRIVREMVIAILNLANRYPELGSGGASLYVGSLDDPCASRAPAC